MRLALTAEDRIVVERDGGFVDVSPAFADIRFRTADDRMPRVIASLPDRRERIEQLAFMRRSPSRWRLTGSGAAAAETDRGIRQLP